MPGGALDSAAVDILSPCVWITGTTGMLGLDVGEAAAVAGDNSALSLLAI